jgi:hypothetical protein
VEPGLEIYYDASFYKQQLSGGVGVWVADFKHSLSYWLPCVPNVMVAELVAIAVAVEHGI